MNKIKEYFNLTKNEQRGIIVLLIIIILLTIAPKVIDQFIKPPWFMTYNFAAHKKNDSVSPAQNSIIKIPVNPNTATANELTSIGIPPEIAFRIIKFRKNYIFRKNKDLMKVYGINDSIYNLIAENIIIDNKFHPTPKKNNNIKNTPYKTELATKSQPTHNHIHININTADSLELLKLNGIGPVFAQRIINYRNLLGGFYSEEQLLEVYGFDSNKLSSIRNNIYIDSTNIIKVNINNTDFKTINKHPYLSYTHTKSLFNYRKIMKHFNSVNDILANNLMDSTSFEKAKYYLTVE